MHLPADPSASTSFEVRRIAALLALLWLACWLWATLHDSAPPTRLPDASGLRFPCLSYAPFRERGNAPTVRHLIIPAQAIERDLRQIAQLSHCVRIYGTANGLDAVPAIARRLGMRVWLGAWLGSDPALNRRELESALQLARQHTDIVDRLVVGSEVLLRRELPVTALTALLDEARRRSPVPIAYADVWEFWLRHADALRPHVDEAVIHVLPYWEDRPVAVEEGVAHVLAIRAQVSAQLAPLPVVIGETGWPSAGRMRAGARPGSDEQTRFLRELLVSVHALRSPLPSSALNVIEAFDQPWKVTLEGMAGASWGLFTADGEPRYQAAGAATLRSPRWLTDIAMAGGAMALLLGSFLARQGSGSVGWRCAIALAGGAALGALCLLQARDLALLTMTDVPAGWRLAVLLGSAPWAMVEVQALAAVCSRSPPASSPRLLHALRSAGLIGTLAYALWLLIDGRYLDLAWPALAAPVLPFALHRLLGTRERHHAVAITALAALLALAAIGVVLSEGVRNSSAVAVAVLMLLLAACSLRAPTCRDRR